MRYLIVFLIGLLAGSVLAWTAAHTLDLRHAYPKAVMVVMQHHYQALRRNLAQGDCNPADSARRLQRLHAAVEEMPEAFADRFDQAEFEKRYADLRRTVAASAQPSQAGCNAFNAAVRDVGEQCQACHQQFR